MKVKLGEIWNSVDALNKLKKCQFKDVIQSYEIRKLLADIQKEAQSIDVVRLELVKKHGSEITRENEKGKEVGTGRFQIQPDNKNYEKFMVDIQTLFEKEVELKKHNKINIKDLNTKKANADILTPEVLDQIAWLIK